MVLRLPQACNLKTCPKYQSSRYLLYMLKKREQQEGSQGYLHTSKYCRVPGRTMWSKCIVLPGTHHVARWMRLSLDTYFNSSPIYHLYVLFVEIWYQARFCIQILYPESFFKILKGFLNCGSVILHVLYLGTSARVHTVSFPARHARSRSSSGHPTVSWFPC